MIKSGYVAEWTKAAVLKSVIANNYRGFESHRTLFFLKYILNIF